MTTPDQESKPTLFPRIPATGNRKLEIAAASFAVAQTVWSGVKAFRARQQERNTVTLKFRDQSLEHRWVCRWIARQPVPTSIGRARSFVAATANGNSFGDVPRSSRRPEPLPAPRAGEQFWALIPTEGAAFFFEGVPLEVSQTRDHSVRNGAVVLSRDIEVCVRTRDPRVVDRFLETLREIGEEETREEKIPGVYVVGRYNDWDHVRDAPANRLPVLAPGVLESLQADLSWFFDSENWFHSVGVPYRRGYMFHGVPGSGKTTTAIALAATLKKDIYVLALDNLDDQALAIVTSAVPGDGVLLIEDIDCISASLDRDTHDSQDSGGRKTPTLQGLLNAIDGAATPDGRIIIATTNRIGVLDKALVRPGRFDRCVEFTYACAAQLRELALRFGLAPDEAAEFALQEGQIAMAEAQRQLIERVGLGQ